MRHQPPEMPLALGPYAYDHDHRADLFNAVSRSMTDAGYRIAVSQPSGGSLVAPIRTRVRHAELNVRVQLFREGWVGVTADLPEHRGLARRVRNEAERLAVRIADDLEAGGFSIEVRQ